MAPGHYIGEPEFRCLAAAADQVIPADQWPGGWAGGVREYLLSGSVPAPRQEALGRLCRILDAASASHGGFASLGKADQHVILRRLNEDPSTSGLVQTLVAICMQGYYGGSSESPPAGWRMLGYRPWPHGSMPANDSGQALTTVDRYSVHSKYDFVVVGSGPGGGVAARVLSAAGASVLIVERARPLTDSELMGDHIRGKRMAVSRVTAGPGKGHPRVIEEPDGNAWVADSLGSGYSWGLNAMCLGGGTRLWQGMAWRFLPQDFRMASLYGVPPGSSLVDWPVDYTEIAPFYDMAESELGISGAVGALTRRWPEHPGYPMPALPDDDVRRLLGRAADRLGWEWGPIPFAINSQRYAGRAPCAGCWQCMGHACPVGAKNGSHNTVIPVALWTGRCDLLMSALATRIHHSKGRAYAIDLLTEPDAGAHPLTVRFDRLVLSAGAVETPRLLLLSGLGNSHVGSHLHAHSVCRVVGRPPEHTATFRGPGHSVATLDFAHDGSGVMGGGVVFDCFAPYPLQLAEWGQMLSGAAYGSSHKGWVRSAVGSIIGTMAMGQQIPRPDSRVLLDPNVTDRFGAPVARVRRRHHAETLRNRRYLINRCVQWLEGAGCRDIADVSVPLDDSTVSPVTEHSAGTVRMGIDPGNSAATADGRVRETDNVYAADASLLPTSGGLNPALTIMANAYRIATAWASAG